MCGWSFAVSLTGTGCAGGDVGSSERAMAASLEQPLSTASSTVEGSLLIMHLALCVHALYRLFKLRHSVTC